MIVPAASKQMRAVRESSWPLTRARIALLLVLLYAGASTLRWLHRGTEWTSGPVEDEISRYERRFQDLRAFLPERGTVGYLGHPEPTGATPRDSNAAALLHFRRLLLAQYALAPLVLIENTEPEFVLGNFDAGAVPPPPPGMRVMRDLGNGLVLFRRLAP
jgi:hypothetical protein